jgi:hypothetical protein
VYKLRGFSKFSMGDWKLLRRDTVEHFEERESEDELDVVEETELLRGGAEVLRRGGGRWHTRPRRLQSPQTGCASSHFLRLERDQ